MAGVTYEVKMVAESAVPASDGQREAFSNYFAGKASLLTAATLLLGFNVANLSAKTQRLVEDVEQADTMLVLVGRVGSLVSCTTSTGLLMVSSFGLCFQCYFGTDTMVADALNQTSNTPKFVGAFSWTSKVNKWCLVFGMLLFGLSLALETLGFIDFSDDVFSESWNSTFSKDILKSILMTVCCVCFSSAVIASLAVLKTWLSMNSFIQNMDYGMGVIQGALPGSNAPLSMAASPAQPQYVQAGAEQEQSKSRAEQEQWQLSQRAERSAEPELSLSQSSRARQARAKARANRASKSKQSESIIQAEQAERIPLLSQPVEAEGIPLPDAYQGACSPLALPGSNAPLSMAASPAQPQYVQAGAIQPEQAECVPLLSQPVVDCPLDAALSPPLDGPTRHHHKQWITLPRGSWAVVKDVDGAHLAVIVDSGGDHNGHCIATWLEDSHMRPGIQGPPRKLTKLVKYEQIRQIPFPGQLKVVFGGRHGSIISLDFITAEINKTGFDYELPEKMFHWPCIFEEEGTKKTEMIKLGDIRDIDTNTMLSMPFLAWGNDGKPSEKGDVSVASSWQQLIDLYEGVWVQTTIQSEVVYGEPVAVY